MSLLLGLYNTKLIVEKIKPTEANIHPFSFKIMKKTTPSYKKIYLTLGILFISLMGFSQSPFTDNTNNGSETFVVPTGVTSVTVQIWGAGGGGGGSTTSGSGGSGGGGGGYTTKTFSVTAGENITYTIGTGGIAGTSAGVIGGTGVTTTLNHIPSTTVLTGTGGTGGNFNKGTVGSGGSGTGGTTTAGSPGIIGTTSGGNGGNGGNAASTGGAGSLNLAGVAGTIPGGGGGGGERNGGTNMAGGAGANGQVTITFTCPSYAVNAGTDQSVCTTTATLAGSAIPSGTTGTWSLVSGTATITSPNSPTSGVTGLVTGSATLRWNINNGRCGTTTDDVVINTTLLPIAATPLPATAATGICYAGTTPVTSVSWGAVSGATSYDVYFGAGSLPGTVTSNVGTATTYSTGTLLASTTYYWKVVAKNACGDATGSTTWTFTTASSPCLVYCPITTSSVVDGTGITNVSYSSVNNTTSDTGNYNNYSATQIGNAAQGATMPISVTISVGKTNYNIKVWVDWNNDGDFLDAGEEMLSGNDSKNLIGTFVIPATASVGNHRMRVGITQGQGNGVKNEAAVPCFNGDKGAFEDYTINVTAATCTTAIPTVTTSPSSVTIANNANTSFTATFTNTPTSYLWEVSSDGGNNYTPITNGGVYSTSTTQTLNLTAANYGMNGFKYRVSASNACGTSSLSAIATLTVTAPGYCDVSSSTAPTTYYISNFESTGNLLDTANLSNSYSTNGYGDFTAIKIATQIPGGAANFSINVLPFGTTFDQKQRVSCFVDWNSDGVFADPSERVYSSNGISILETTFGFTVPQTTNPGNYRMRVRTRRPTVADGVAVAPCTLYTTGGETEDYTIAVVQDCSSKILSVTNGSQCGTNTVTLGAVGLGGTTQYKWYTAATGGTLLATTATGSWTTPSLTATTVYYVTAFNGSCESLVRTRVVATIVPTTTIVFSPTNPSTCGEDNVITINAAGDTTVLDLFNEDFEGTTYGLTATMSGTGGAASPWAPKTNPDDSTTIIWKPTISSGSIGTKFALTSSDYGGANLVTRYTTTNVINTTDFIDLTLTFRHYFSYYPAPTINYGNVQVSFDVGNTTWFNVGVTYGSDTGVASKFVDASIDLTPFVGKTNLKFRFEYTANYADGWAIDDIRLFGTKQLYTTFTWSAASPVAAYTDYACNTPYVAQKVNVIYLKPDLTQLETVTFPITVNATLGNGCPVSQIITVTNSTKVWRGDVPGTSDTTLEWNNPNNWRPVGVPDATNCVIGPENTVISGTNYNAYAKNVVVKSTGTFEIQAGNNLTVTDFIKVETGGVFNLRNNATIIQTTDVANTGNVNIQRITKPMSYYDYTYWNSPVTFASNFTLSSLSPGTASDIWSYSPSISGGSGNWVRLSSSTVMTPTKGYIVKAPDTFSSSTKVAYNATFVGTPNNGPILAPISKGSDANLGGLVTAEDDEWNLIGNPYPSGLDAKKFLDLPANTNIVDGTIYIWTHITAPSAAAPDQFYGDYVLNYTSDDYASFNKTGGTGTTSTNGGNAPSGFIASGQAFFVKAAPTMANGATLNATFNNSMRVTNNSDAATGTNSDFFKKRNTPKTVSVEEEKHRIWLNLTNNSGAFSQTLIGYISGATQGLDRSYDGESFGGNDVTFYSIIPEADLTIQGRALPFDTNDTVPLGYNAAKKGNYSIRIDHLDGLFDNQDIFLEDKDLNIIHDLKKKPYVFNTKVGDFNNRFVLRYGNNYKTLGVEENTKNSDAIKISYAKNSNVLIINNNSLTVPVEKVTLFNIAGQSIATWKVENQEQHNIQIPIKSISAGIYIAKLKTSNGEQSKKIIIP